MEAVGKSALLALISDDLVTIGIVASNLDYDDFRLLVIKKAGDFIQAVNRNLVDILMFDDRSKNYDTGLVHEFFQKSLVKLPVVLITDKESKLKPDFFLQVDEVLYRPVAPLEINIRLAAIKGITELIQQLVGEPVAPSGQPRILVVEDSAVQRHVLTSYFTGQGFEVFGAADGEEALELANTRLPDVILLDLVLPKMDGLEVCRRLKSYYPTATIPIVFITASYSIEERIQALKCGAHDFLVKPVNQQELLIRVKSLLRHKQLVETLVTQACRDPLTGLYNRRQMMTCLYLEMQRARRYNTSLSLILLDVDYFKNYNDSRGHLAGDEALRQLSTLLNANVRAFDKVARYGGEEFVIILPQTDLQGAVASAEKLCWLVENHPFPEAEVQPGGRFTISLGISVYPDHADNVDGLLFLADKAMYQAKAAGRNRYAVACRIVDQQPQSSFPDGGQAIGE
jgi:diguanylate cyclase (GGDEF)-like protein